VHRRHLDLLRGLTALTLLLALLVGLPIALVTAVGWPLPTDLPTWTAFERTLTHGELDTWTLVKALAVLVWLAWAQLTASAVAELVAIVRGRRASAVPSSRALRHAAANLVTTAALLFSSAGRLADAATPPRPELHVALATAPPAPVSAAPLPGATGEPRMHLAAAPTSVEAPTDAPVRSATPIWRVQPRDTLWGIAQTVLGDGLRWREIRDLNVGRPQPDGGRLRRDDDLIRPGWVLTLPPDATTSKTVGEAPPTDRPEATSPETSTTITVEPGDTLWDLAAAHLDDPHRWPELYEQNRHRSQPDGRHLTDPDLIHPGWQLTVPTADGHRSEPPDDAETATAPAEDDTPPTSAPPAPAEQHPIPWAMLEPGPAPSPEPSPEAHATDNQTPAPPHAAPSTNRSTTRQPPADDAADDPDGEHEDADNSLVLLVGAGLLAAGATATLDRIRRGKRRRRQPGQRIVLPKGSLARTEQRVRGLADADTVDLLDVVLRSLVAACDQGGRGVPDIALVSVGPHDVAVHLADPDVEPPDGWQLEDAGMTWVTPRPADLDELRDLAASALSPVPLLVTIGTHAHGKRRVLLNLGHARLLDLHADDETTRTVILGQALELATSARADALSILLAGAGDALATLERVRCLPEEATVELLRRAAEDAEADDPEATAALFVTPPPPDIEEALSARDDGRTNTVAAVAPQLPNATWRLTIEPTIVRVAPYGLELQPLELTGDDLDAIADLLEDAAIPTFVEATPDEPDEPDEPVGADEADAAEDDGELPLVAHSTNGQVAAVAATVADAADEHGIEVRVLGPVEIAGASDFESAKAEELVVYLALHRDPVDHDTLQEALWPGQTPNVGRLHTTVWRARQALGDDPEGKPYLPKAKQGRYRLSPTVTCDLDRFHAHIRRARTDPAVDVAELRSALELVRGRPLSATSGEYSWAINDVHALEQDVSDAAHQLAQLYLENDQPQAVRWAAEGGLLADPYCEVLYRDLMTAAAAAGNAAEIHQIMRRFREVLDLDADANDADDLLDPATTQLYNELTRKRAGNSGDADGWEGSSPGRETA
jgi:DNA-binding SARP family transcriptional activator/nucleoid-associated protein YgaU